MADKEDAKFLAVMIVTLTFAGLLALGMVGLIFGY